MNKLPSMEILGIPVHPLAMSEAVTYLVDRVKQKLVTNVVTANAEIIMLGQRDPEYKQILQEADCVLPDGAGTVWAGRTLGYRVPERVAGFDLFLELIKAAPANKLKVYFFGSAPGIADAAKAKCEVMAPGVEIVGCRNGYFTDGDVPDIIADINASGADMLFVALGAPKQEYWLKANKDNLKPYLRIGLGGSFDVLAGKMARAPKWMQDASLEWLFRLYKNPSRLVRMLVLPKFVIKVLTAKYSGK
jgi:N-acetylglucosaminyldiphosphoundecaprenol N-acetyl-beta-D-mannosaminyltransferase